MQVCDLENMAFRSKCSTEILFLSKKHCVIRKSD